MSLTLTHSATRTAVVVLCGTSTFDAYCISRSATQKPHARGYSICFKGMRFRVASDLHKIIKNKLGIAKKTRKGRVIRLYDRFLLTTLATGVEARLILIEHKSPQITLDEDSIFRRHTISNQGFILLFNLILGGGEASSSPPFLLPADFFHSGCRPPTRSGHEPP